MTNNLCKLISECKAGGGYTSTNDFIVKELNTQKINEKLAKQEIEMEIINGFMVFSKETYTKNELEKLSNKNKFLKYAYKHRYYALYKISNENNSTLTFILYNPSYANPEVLDDTIYNCIDLAKRTHYCNVEILNLFSLRATVPSAEKLEETNSINSIFLKKYIDESDCKDKTLDIVAAWGCGKDKKNKYHQKYCNEIYDKLKNKNAFFIGIDTTKINQQINRHPDKRIWNGMGGLGVAKLVPVSPQD